MQSHSYFPFGIGTNVFTSPLMSQPNKIGGDSIPPSTNSYWVEDLTHDQMVTEDLSKKYVFVGA